MMCYDPITIQWTMSCKKVWMKGAGGGRGENQIQFIQNAQQKRSYTIRFIRSTCWAITLCYPVPLPSLKVFQFRLSCAAIHLPRHLSADRLFVNIDWKPIPTNKCGRDKAFQEDRGDERRTTDEEMNGNNTNIPVLFGTFYSETSYIFTYRYTRTHMGYCFCYDCFIEYLWSEITNAAPHIV